MRPVYVYTIHVIEGYAVIIDAGQCTVAWIMQKMFNLLLHCYYNLYDESTSLEYLRRYFLIQVSCNVTENLIATEVSMNLSHSWLVVAVVWLGAGSLCRAQSGEEDLMCSGKLMPKFMHTY